MQISRLLLLTMVVGSVLLGCKRADTPEIVTEKFMNHLLASQFAEAKALGTESTAQMLEIFETIESLSGEKPADSLPTATISNIQCEVTGDAALCSFEENGQMSELNLVKVDGKWLVDMKKENPYGGMGGEGEVVTPVAPDPSVEVQ